MKDCVKSSSLDDDEGEFLLCALHNEKRHNIYLFDLSSNLHRPKPAHRQRDTAHGPQNTIITTRQITLNGLRLTTYILPLTYTDLQTMPS
jgi:hypothetical protein